MSWILLYAVAVSGVAISVGMMALYYLHRVTDTLRQTREDMGLMFRLIDWQADENRKSHYALLHPEQQRERKAA